MKTMCQYITTALSLLVVIQPVQAQSPSEDLVRVMAVMSPEQPWAVDLKYRYFESYESSEPADEMDARIVQHGMLRYDSIGPVVRVQSSGQLLAVDHDEKVIVLEDLGKSGVHIEMISTAPDISALLAVTEKTESYSAGTNVKGLRLLFTGTEYLRAEIEYSAADFTPVRAIFYYRFAEDDWEGGKRPPRLEISYSGWSFSTPDPGLFSADQYVTYENKTWSPAAALKGYEIVN